MEKPAGKRVGLKAKYMALAMKYNRAVQSINRNRSIYQRLARNYAVLKQRLTRTKLSADREKRALITRRITEKYPLVLDHRHRIVFAADHFLEEIEMTRDELASSFYLDTLFAKHLPNDYTVKDGVPIPPFHFPFMLTNYRYEGEQDIHPFVHYLMEGKREYDPKKRAFLFYLELKDISSEVELEYFQKSDILIRRLSSANVRLQRANKAIEVHKFMLISLVCSLIEEYNRETSAHLQNIRILTGFLTEECLRQNIVPPAPYEAGEYLKDINYTSVLHDIGKMGIPRELLEKKGPLTAEEQESIKAHPADGAAYIRKMMDMFRKEEEFRGYEEFLKIPYEICLHHHERWDGSGYPDGLGGVSIPFCARVVSLVDTYDAMRMQRSYNKRKPHGECLRVISEESGKQFDPALVRAFLNVESKFESLDYGD